MITTTKLLSFEVKTGYVEWARPHKYFCKMNIENTNSQTSPGTVPPLHGPRGGTHARPPEAPPVHRPPHAPALQVQLVSQARPLQHAD